MRKILLLVGLLPTVALAQSVPVNSVDSGATTQVALTQLVTAAATTQRMFIHGWTCSASVASTATADEHCVLKYGTGTNCATGTTVLLSAMTPAVSHVSENFSSPIIVPAKKNLCYIHAAAGTKRFNVRYRFAP
jgi:hypothetical protein